jgi:hypothetical protein
MDIELRPLRLAEILDRIFQLYRARFVLFLGIATVCTIVELVWNLVSLVEVRWMTAHHVSTTHRNWISSVSVVPGWIFVFVAAALCLAAVNRAVAAIHDGKPIGILTAFAALRSSWLKCVWVNTLAFLIAWGSMIVVVVGGVTATLLATQAKTLGQANVIALVFGATGLLVFLVLPLCVWLTIRYSLAVPACVEEGLGTLRSLKRSVFLAQNEKGRILVLLLIVLATQSALATAFMAPVLPFILKMRGQVSPAMTVYTVAVSALSSILIKPIYSIGLTLFYYDARVRKEGFDLERMLERSSTSTAGEGLPSTGFAV